jgi:tRNA/rRNA methyltransferase
LPSFKVVLVEPQFEETIGLVSRAMMNFAIADLQVVNPIAPVGKMARLRASHAQAVLDRVEICSSLREALAKSDMSVGTTAQRAHSIYRILRKPVTPSHLAQSMKSVKGTVALVFGREGTGLTNKELDQCEVTLTIPASPEYSTLNISHAAAIIFYELYQARNGIDEEVLAGLEVKKRILGFVDSAAETLKIPKKEKRVIQRAVKSVMGRSSLRAREASLLAGFLRRVTNGLTEHLEEGSSRGEATAKRDPSLMS